MEKKKFSEVLEKRIQQLNPVERQRIITFYEETIEDSMEDGKSEEEAVASLGDMDMIVKDILQENNLSFPVKEKSAFHSLDKKWRYLILFCTSPLWMMLLVVMLMLFLVGCMLLFWGFVLIGCLWIMPIIIVLSSILILPFHIVQNFPYSVLVIGLALISAAWAILVSFEIKRWWKWMQGNAQTFMNFVLRGYKTLKEKVVA